MVTTDCDVSRTFCTRNNLHTRKHRNVVRILVSDSRIDTTDLHGIIA